MNSTFFFEKGVVMKKQFDERNLTMVMDFYELTMANGYFKDEDKERKVAFDVFYRKNPDNAGYAIFAGLEQIIEYIENLHFDEDDIEYLRGQGLFGEEFLAYLAEFKFRGDIYSFPEGTIMQDVHITWMQQYMVQEQLTSVVQLEQLLSLPVRCLIFQSVEQWHTAG